MTLTTIVHFDAHVSKIASEGRGAPPQKYFIPGCDGMGVRLGSVSSPGAGGSGGALKSGNLESWESRNSEIWKSRDLESNKNQQKNPRNGNPSCPKCWQAPH